jgi:hypothetical protein
MAATNKCLAQSNNSRTGDEATKKSERIYQQRLRFRRSAARRKVRQRASAHFRTVSLGELDMISKTILVFWTVTCFLIAVQVISGDTTGGTWFVIVAQGITWAIVAVPTALIGSLFNQRHTKNMFSLAQRRALSSFALLLWTGSIQERATTQRPATRPTIVIANARKHRNMVLPSVHFRTRPRTIAARPRFRRAVGSGLMGPGPGLRA